MARKKKDETRSYYIISLIVKKMVGSIIIIIFSRKEKKRTKVNSHLYTQRMRIEEEEDLESPVSVSCQTGLGWAVKIRISI